MSKSLKIGIILVGMIFIIFVVFILSSRPSQYKNPESLQGVDESIFNR